VGKYEERHKNQNSQRFPDHPAFFLQVINYPFQGCITSSFFITTERKVFNGKCRVDRMLCRQRFQPELSAKVKRIALTFSCNHFQNGGMCFEKLQGK